MKRLLAAGVVILLLLSAGGCRNTIPWFYEPDDALAGDNHDYATRVLQPHQSQLSEVR